MIALAAIELYGRPVSTPVLILGGVAFLILFFMVAADGGLGDGTGAGARGGAVRRGRMYRCQRCGTRFQPERVELLSSGDTRTTFDERCPNCGWELDWGDPDRKKLGGASGTW